MPGCELHNDCFTCPYPDCELSDHGHPRKTFILRQKVKVLAKQEYPTPLIAKELGRSVRQIQRYLTELRRTPNGDLP